MGKRIRITFAIVMLLVGATSVSVAYIGGGTLSASSVAQTGFDWGRVFIWGGAATLAVSAFMFLSASAE